MAAILILLAGCTGLVEGVLIKKYNAKHKKGGFIFTGLVSLFSMLFFVVTDRGGFYFPSGIFPYALTSGALFCIASFLTYVALGCGPFAVSMLILSYSGVFSVVYGLVFLHEQASAFTYIGFALIIISLFLTRGDSRADADKKASFKWLVCMILSVIGMMTPVWAAVFHAASTIVIIFNSARLVRVGEELTIHSGIDTK